jgi:hypothetical protein
VRSSERHVLRCCGGGCGELRRWRVRWEPHARASKAGHCHHDHNAKHQHLTTFERKYPFNLLFNHLYSRLLLITVYPLILSLGTPTKYLLLRKPLGINIYAVPASYAPSPLPYKRKFQTVRCAPKYATNSHPNRTCYVYS